MLISSESTNPYTVLIRRIWISPIRYQKISSPPMRDRENMNQLFFMEVFNKVSTFHCGYRGVVDYRFLYNSSKLGVKNENCSLLY